MSGAAVLVFLAEVAILLGLCLLSDLVTQWLSLWGCLKTVLVDSLLVPLAVAGREDLLVQHCTEQELTVGSILEFMLYYLGIHLLNLLIPSVHINVFTPV